MPFAEVASSVKNPNQNKNGTKGGEAEWSRETQNELAKKIHAQSKLDLANLKDHLPFRKVQRGDTLGALAKGLTGKLDYSMAVDYRSTKLGDKPKPTTLQDANLIYPDQFVWIEKGRIVVSDEPPAQAKSAPVSVKEAAPVPVVAPVSASGKETAPVPVVAPAPASGKEAAPAPAPVKEAAPAPAPVKEAASAPAPAQETVPASSNTLVGSESTHLYSAAESARVHEKALAQAQAENRFTPQQRAAMPSRAEAGLPHNIPDLDAEIAKIATQSGVTPEATRAIVDDLKAIPADLATTNPAEFRAQVERAAAGHNPSEFTRVAESAMQLSGGLAFLRSAAARGALRGLPVFGGVNIWGRALGEEKFFTGWKPEMEGLKPKTGNGALDTAAYFVPFAGNLLDYADAGNNWKNGEYGKMALNLTSGTIGMALDAVSFGLAWTGLGLPAGQSAKFGIKGGLRLAVKLADKAPAAVKALGSKLVDGANLVGHQISRGFDWFANSVVGRGLDKVFGAPERALAAVGQRMDGNFATKMVKETVSSIYGVMTFRALRNPGQAVDAVRAGAGDEPPKDNSEPSKTQESREEIVEEKAVDVNEPSKDNSESSKTKKSSEQLTKEKEALDQELKKNTEKKSANEAELQKLAEEKAKMEGEIKQLDELIATTRKTINEIKTKPSEENNEKLTKLRDMLYQLGQQKQATIDSNRPRTNEIAAREQALKYENTEIETRLQEVQNNLDAAKLSLAESAGADSAKAGEPKEVVLTSDRAEPDLDLGTKSQSPVDLAKVESTPTPATPKEGALTRVKNWYQTLKAKWQWGKPKEVVLASDRAEPDLDSSQAMPTSAKSAEAPALAKELAEQPIEHRLKEVQNNLDAAKLSLAESAGADSAKAGEPKEVVLAFDRTDLAKVESTPAPATPKEGAWTRIGNWAKEKWSNRSWGKPKETAPAPARVELVLESVKEQAAAKKVESAFAYHRNYEDGQTVIIQRSNGEYVMGIINGKDPNSNLPDVHFKDVSTGTVRIKGYQVAAFDSIPLNNLPIKLTLSSGEVLVKIGDKQVVRAKSVKCDNDHYRVILSHDGVDIEVTIHSSQIEAVNSTADTISKQRADQEAAALAQSALAQKSRPEAQPPTEPRLNQDLVNDMMNNPPAPAKLAEPEPVLSKDLLALKIKEGFKSVQSLPLRDLQPRDKIFVQTESGSTMSFSVRRISQDGNSVHLTCDDTTSGSTKKDTSLTLRIDSTLNVGKPITPVGGNGNLSKPILSIAFKKAPPLESDEPVTVDHAEAANPAGIKATKYFALKRPPAKPEPAPEKRAVNLDE